ncbi:MAG: DNA binding domain protein [Podoviridae sp. ctviO18]|nr:MAG: DNA binding domain protein [Podoviridae sp. ctviO18]
MNKLEKNEQECIDYLYGQYEFVLPYESLVKGTGLTIRQVKRAIRSLVKQGKVERTTAWDDDGFLRGSGFMLEYETYRKIFNQEQPN